MLLQGGSHHLTVKNTHFVKAVANDVDFYRFFRIFFKNKCCDWRLVEGCTPLYPPLILANWKQISNSTKTNLLETPTTSKRKSLITPETVGF